jgi:CheY-like chemotaxis protein
MDLSMPVIDGWEATRQLKANAITKKAVVIAVTAHAFPREQEAARAAGCDAVIAKPYDLAGLAAALHRVIRKGVSALDAKGTTLTVALRPPP